jgi:hypothetical protein
MLLGCETMAMLPPVTSSIQVAGFWPDAMGQVPAGADVETG